jgi:hypothetical protein
VDPLAPAAAAAAHPRILSFVNFVMVAKMAMIHTKI